MIEIFKQYLCELITTQNLAWPLIEPICKLKVYSRKERIFTEGAICNNYIFVLNGCLRTCCEVKGIESVVSFSQESQWAGDYQSISTGQASRFSIEAVEDTSVILIDRNDLELVENEIPVLNHAIRQWRYNDFINSQYRIHAAHSLNAVQRYENFLKHYPGLLLRLPQSMIASYLGMNPETLSRARKKTCRSRMKINTHGKLKYSPFLTQELEKI